MPTAPRFPTDREPTIEVRPALGRFDDFSTVVGTRRPGARGCWCMAYRDSRVPAGQRPDRMREQCGTEPGPGAPRSSRATRWMLVAVASMSSPGYVGTVELFARAGFRRVSPTTGHGGGRPRWVMRRTLRPGPR